MKHAAAICVLLLSVSGCSSIPFESPARVPLSQEDPKSVLKRFEQKQPVNFTLLNTIVFRFGFFRRVSALGFIEVETGEREFTVVCINPLGVKLFEIAAAGDEIRRQFALGPLAGKPGFAKVVANDIRKIYFDLIPPPDARIIRSHRRLAFESAGGDGTTEYVFSGPGPNLHEKRYYRDGDMKWRVGYFEYRESGGKLFPGGVVLDNFEYGYRLIIKLKEINDTKQS